MRPYIVVDLETQSNVDLRERGGFVYAEACKLICASWSEDGETFHVWFPHHARFPQHHIDTHLSDVTLHFGGEPPIPRDRPWCGHNAFSFDEPVWEALYPDHLPTAWQDSQCLALAAGLPAGLNQISIRLFGEGKQESGAKVLKDASNSMAPVPPPVAAAIASYNVQDVKLQGWVMEEIEASYHQTPMEARVLAAHRLINRRGVALDAGLITKLHRLSDDSVDYAVDEIRKLTDGHLHSLKCLRSRTKMIKWIDDMGFKCPQTGGKASLRREIIEQWIDEQEEEEEEEAAEASAEDAENDAEAPAKLFEVINVLQLRQMAMRTTGHKLAAAGLSVNSDGRARGLSQYHGAGTGRSAGRRVNFKNLPRPKEGIDFWGLVDGELTLECVLQSLAAATVSPGARRPTPDDVASAMIRGIILGPMLQGDLSNIEVRVLAWLAGEDWLLETLRAGDDPYIAFVKKVTGKSVDRKHPLRQVFKVVELGAGYQIGATKLAVYLATQGVDLEALGLTAAQLVEDYRNAHPKIAGEVVGTWEGKSIRREGLWQNYEAAALACIRSKLPIHVGRCTFEYARGHIYVTLPSGRQITYRNARIESQPYYGKWRDTVVYQSARFKSVAMYGGKWAENITQAVARDVMVEMLVLTEENGLCPILEVYDEIGCECDPSLLPEFARIMTTVPTWCPDMPVDAEGTWLPRYAKSPPPPRKDYDFKKYLLTL